MWDIAAMAQAEIVPAAGAELTQGDWERTIGQVADRAARQGVFEEHLRDKAPNTLRTYRSSLQTFCDEYLPVVQVHRDVNAMMEAPEQWAFLSYGIVKGFREWLLQQGYALSSVSQKLSAVKMFARLAGEAGALSPDVVEQVNAVKGPPVGKQGVRLDERREQNGVDTRMSTKKPDALLLTVEEARALRSDHPDTPQGRRDRLLCCLGLDHAMRASELSALAVADVDMEANTIRIYRQKTGLEQIDRIMPPTREALEAYLKAGDAPKEGQLLRGSRKGGRLRDGGMTPSRISVRVNEIARRILDRDDITAHDLRATYATHAAIARTDQAAIRSGGGWKTMHMVDHYQKAAGIGQKANERVNLPL